MGKQCAYCGKPLEGLKDANRRNFCSRNCYRFGTMHEEPSKPTMRKRHQREIVFKGRTQICDFCGRRRECQRHHEDISNYKAKVKIACKECHVARDIKLGKWGPYAQKAAASKASSVRSGGKSAGKSNPQLRKTTPRRQAL